jgi:hypothetical protein
MDAERIFAVLGSAASVVALAVAVVQTVRYRGVAKLRQNRNYQTWGAIQVAVHAFDRIAVANKALQDATVVTDETRANIAEARQSVVDVWLRLLEQAIQDEDHFSEDTIAEWTRLGKLENEWRQAAARRYLSGQSAVRRQ